MGYKLFEYFAMVTCLEYDKRGIVLSSVPKIFINGSDKNKLAGYKRLAIMPCDPDYTKSKVILLERTIYNPYPTSKKYILLNYTGKIVKLPESIFSMTLKIDENSLDRYKIMLTGSGGKPRGYYELDSDLSNIKEKIVI